MATPKRQALRPKGTRRICSSRRLLTTKGISDSRGSTSRTVVSMNMISMVRGPSAWAPSRPQTATQGKNMGWL